MSLEHTNFTTAHNRLSTTLATLSKEQSKNKADKSTTSKTPGDFNIDFCSGCSTILSFNNSNWGELTPH